MAEPERWVNFLKFETISVKHIFFNAFGTADNKSGINVVKNKTVEPLCRFFKRSHDVAKNDFLLCFRGR